MAEPRPRTVLVLGAGGFIGSHLVERLLADGGRRVVGVDLESRKVEPLLGRPGFDFRRFDVGDAGRLGAAIAECDAVVNLASLCNPSLYNTRALETIESNLLAAIPVVRACRDARKRLVHFSTCEVYGRTLAGFAPEGSAFREDPANWVLSEESSPMLLGPIAKERWCYAAAKGLLERVIRAEGRENGLRWTILRPFNFLGPRMDFLPGVDGEGLPRVLACFLEALLRRRPLPLVDGGRARRTFVAVEEAVDATVRVLDRSDAADGRVFNLGNPANEHTIADLAARIVRVWERETGAPFAPGVREVPAEEFYGEGYEDSDRRVPDVALARTLLGWEPRETLDSILARVVPWFRREYGGAAR